MKVSLDGHRDRMRERIENIGAADVRSQELMEFLLYHAVPQKDTKQLAFDLLQQFGSLEAILRADEEMLRGVPGMNARIVKWIRLVGKITGIYSGGRGIERHRMDNFKRTQAYFTRFFRDSTYHEAWQCCLTAGGRFISAAKIADNASWGESEYLREALEDAITARAVGVVLGRYSPDSGAGFDEYDIERTRAYAVTLAAANVQLMDHVLICPDGVKSMFHEGGLDRIKCLPSATGLRENYLNENVDPDDDSADDWLWGFDLPDADGADSDLPEGGIAADEIPADEMPADEMPADEMSADEMPADETPADEMPADETPANEIPVE